MEEIIQASGKLHMHTIRKKARCDCGFMSTETFTCNMNLNHVRRFLCSRKKGGERSLCWSRGLIERGVSGVLGSTCQGCCGRVRPPLTALPHLSPLTCTCSSSPLICRRDRPDHWGLYRVTLAPGDGIPGGVCSQQSVYGLPSDKWHSLRPQRLAESVKYYFWTW